MNVAITPTHWAPSRAKISAGDVQQRLTESGSPSLVPNQRRKDIAFLQKQTARDANRLLAFADIDAPSDQATSIKTNEFFLERTRQQHPAERFEESFVRQRTLCLFGF
jgi:hypothetical protein